MRSKTTLFSVSLHNLCLCGSGRITDNVLIGPVRPPVGNFTALNHVLPVNTHL